MTGLPAPVSALRAYARSSAGPVAYDSVTSAIARVKANATRTAATPTKIQILAVRLRDERGLGLPPPPRRCHLNIELVYELHCASSWSSLTTSRSRPLLLVMTERYA
jgi:hypothetical protein